MVYIESGSDDSNPSRQNLVNIQPKEIDVNNSHMSALKTKHAKLEQKVAMEENRPFPDDSLIFRLKKEKLAVKDEIARETSLV